jgi:DNA-binding transcriptional ArsR family regulator
MNEIDATTKNRSETGTSNQGNSAPGLTEDQRHVRFADQLAALGSPVRLAILRRIVQGEAHGTNVGAIQAEVGIPASTLSHHLEKLASTGLVIARPEGRQIFHQADYPALKALTAYVWEDCCGSGRGSCCG